MLATPSLRSQRQADLVAALRPDRDGVFARWRRGDVKATIVALHDRRPLPDAGVADALSMELMRARPERQRVPAPWRPKRMHVPTRRHARAIEIFGQPGGFDPRFAP
jgi:hypothetical protein